VAAAERTLTDAEAARQSANDALSKSGTTKQEAASIPSLLIDTVDNIGGKIDAALVEQGPDVQALASLVSGLARGYGQFFQVPAKGVAPAEGQPVAKAQGAVEDSKLQKLADSLKDLELGRLELDRATRRLADRVNAVAAGKPLDRLQACGVNTDKLSAPFTIEPPGPLQITAGKPTTAGFVIRGGAAPFGVNLEGTSIDGLTVQHRDPMSPAFLIQASDKTTQTSAVIHITDRSGHDQFLAINVVAASGTPQSSAPADKKDPQKWLNDAPGKLVKTPNVQKAFGSNTVKIASATADTTNNVLNVGVTVDDSTGRALSRVPAQTAVNNSKDEILNWIVELLGVDASLKTSIVVQATIQ
jgi:hypothetical protein